MSFRRVSAGSGVNGHTAVVALRGRTPGERGWFDRNFPHWARSLLIRTGNVEISHPSRSTVTRPPVLNVGSTVTSLKNKSNISLINLNELVYRACPAESYVPSLLSQVVCSKTTATPSHPCFW